LGRRTDRAVLGSLFDVRTRTWSTSPLTSRNGSRRAAMRAGATGRTHGLTFGGTFLRLASAGVFALIARPRATDRDPINPLATWTPSTAAADLTERGRADGTTASAVQPRGGETLDSSDAAAVHAPSGGSRRHASDGLAGRRGPDSGGRPSSQERPARTSLRWWRRRSRSRAVRAVVMPTPLFLPRAHGVAAVFGRWWRWRRGLGHHIGPSVTGPWRPSSPPVRGHAGGCRVVVGLQAGKPRRASSSAVRPRAAAVTDFRAEQGLEVAPALPGNDRGARPRGDAGTASRKGKALEGLHRWESVEAIAGMRRWSVATR
jgi:hypothetical protein